MRRSKSPISSSPKKSSAEPTVGRTQEAAGAIRRPFSWPLAGALDQPVAGPTSRPRLARITLPQRGGCRPRCWTQRHEGLALSTSSRRACAAVAPGRAQHPACSLMLDTSGSSSFGRNACIGVRARSPVPSHWILAKNRRPCSVSALEGEIGIRQPLRRSVRGDRDVALGAAASTSAAWRWPGRPMRRHRGSTMIRPMVSPPAHVRNRQR